MNMKRKNFVVMLLALLMVISVMPMPLVSAEDNSTIEDVENITENETIEDGDLNETIDNNGENETIEDTADNETIENETENEAVEEDEEEVDDEDVDEVEDEALKAFTSNFGARVRLLQLYKNLETQIIKGEEVINAINEINPDYDSSELELILENMKALAEQINESVSTIPDEVDQETLQSLASDFVILLNESRSLIRQFSTILHEDFTGEELAQIRIRVNRNAQFRIRERIKAVQEMIKQYIRAHNENIVKRMLGRPDIRLNESALTDKEQLKNQLRNVLRNQNKQIEELKQRIDELRKAHQQQLRRMKVMADERAREKVNAVREKILKRLHERLLEREQLMQRLSDNPRNRTNIDWRGNARPGPQDVPNLKPGRR